MGMPYTVPKVKGGFWNTKTAGPGNTALNGRFIILVEVRDRPIATLTFPGSVAGPGFVVRYGEGDSLRAEAVAEALGPRTRAVVLSSPSNPTGATLTEDQARTLVDLCRARDVHLITGFAERAGDRNTRQQPDRPKFPGRGAVHCGHLSTNRS